MATASNILDLNPSSFHAILVLVQIVYYGKLRSWQRIRLKGFKLECIVVLRTLMGPLALTVTTLTG